MSHSDDRAKSREAVMPLPILLQTEAETGAKVGWSSASSQKGSMQLGTSDSKQKLMHITPSLYSQEHRPIWSHLPDSELRNPQHDTQVHST